LQLTPHRAKHRPLLAVPKKEVIFHSILFPRFQKLDFIIYYFADARGHIYLLDIYLKTAKEDLTTDEIKQLRALIKEWLDE